MPARSEPYDGPAIVTFAKELEWRRTQSGLSKKDLAEKLGFADSYVGQVELRKNLPSKEFAAALDTFFKADGLFCRLWERINETRHIAVVPPGFPEYLSSEAQANYIRNFSPTLVPGLLQTEGYARTVLGANQLPEIVDRLVQERLKRQEVFVGENPPRTWFIMDEIVLRRVVGNSEVMREQLSRMLEFAEFPTNMIHIVPFDVGFHDGLGGMFTILGFEDGTNVVYTESGGEGILIDQAPRVTRHVVRYDLVRGHALSTVESLALIRAVLEGL
ncbi:helix-turn-helix transcriptional regulator [Actinomadura sp. KC345]|uniref:helix-turn-helix domain-containing protein n=1 Tax=Actinomadura sp. KC345 TaxID=2530371 RepID=UPI0014045E2F|nr:helix-turn-helix transcriptional regulator [Actinomadura sp. KC345]